MKGLIRGTAGVLVSAYVLASCSGPSDAEPTCAVSPDGHLVATQDSGKTYESLNGLFGEKVPQAAEWVKGTAGWGRGPVCTTRDGSVSMLMKDFVAGGVVKPHSAQEVEGYNEYVRGVSLQGGPAAGPGR